MDDDALLARIRQIADEIDPVPDHLNASVLLLFEAECLLRLDTHSLLLQVDDPVLASTRSDKPRTLRFADDSHEVVMRITKGPDELVRIDGWMSPVATGKVVLHTCSNDLKSQVAKAGRFQFGGLPSGLTNASFDPGTADTPGPGWRTPTFRI